MSTKSLIKSTGVISIATLVGKVLGFVRLVLIARFFGTGKAIQAFFVAFRIPNLLRDMVAEGAANSAIVPVLSEYLIKKKKEEYWHLVNILLNIALICLMTLVVAGLLLAPAIVRIIAPGFTRDPEQFRLAVSLTRLIFPYILLIGLAAYAMGVLNSLKHFSAPAFAPCLLNISVITTILVLNRNVSVKALAFAVLIGGVLQLLVQIPVLYKKGMRLRTFKIFRHEAVKKIGKLLVPRAPATIVYQLNVLIDTMLASLHWIVGAGGIAALFYSYSLIRFPTGIFATSLAIASLPVLSEHFARRDMAKFKRTINFLLRASLLLVIPATVAFMILGDHIIRILFQSDKFGDYSVMITNQALFFYSIGLFSYAGIKILVFSFYSMQDTITPLKTSAAALVVNIILNLILMWPLKIGGLALATSAAGIFNFSILFYLLRKRIGSFGEKEILVFSAKSILAAALMGMALYITARYFDNIMLTKGTVYNVAYLAFSIGLGIVVYFATLYMLKVKELGKFLAWVLKRQ